MAPRFPPEFGARRCKAPSRGEEGRGPAGFALGSGPRQSGGIECLVGLEPRFTHAAPRSDGSNAWDRRRLHYLGRH
jgi:hypothetical protein